MSKKDFFESKNVKELCRSGIPFKYFKDVTLKLFNFTNDDTIEHFTIRKDKVFKGVEVKDVGNYVPYFTGNNSFEESFNYDILTEEGILSVKEIQWMLNSVIPTIEHSPILIKLNALLHFLLEPYEVYSLLRSLINMNYNKTDLHKIRWHLRFQYEDNIKLAQSILESYKELAGKPLNTGLENLESIGFSPIKLIEDMIFAFFINYLSIEGLMRLLPFYLREGVKALYRITYAVLKEINPHLCKISNKHTVIEEAKKACKGITDYKKLFASAFEYYLTRNNNKFVLQEFKDDVEDNDLKKSNFYLPLITRFPKCHSILNNQMILSLWSEIPSELKVKDLHMIFSTDVDGFSIKTIFEAGGKLLDKNLNSPSDYTTLFVIETQNNEIFGGLMSRLIVPTEKNFNRPYNILLLSFLPQLKIYQPSEDSGDILFIDDQSFLYGIGDCGASIRLNSDMSHGYSHKSTAFTSPVLTKSNDGEYHIKKVEVYIIS